MSLGAILLGAALISAALAAPLPASASTTTIELGTAAGYSAFAGASVVNTGPSALSGNVGVSPGVSVTGFPPGTLTGTIHRADVAASAAHNDLVSAYADAVSRPLSAVIAGDLAGRTLTAGVYRSAAALSISTNLTLDGGSDPDSVFIFQVDAALGTAAASRIILTNGAQASRVFWQVAGATSLGAMSSFSGTVLGLEAVTVGASAGVIGRVFSVNGALSLSSNPINPEGPLQLGTAFDYSVLAATAVVNSGASTLNASVGVSPGTSVTGFPPGIIDGALHIADAQAAQAQTDLRTAYGEAAARPASRGLAPSPGGLTLIAGVHRSGGSVDIRSNLVLDGQGNPNSIFILQVRGDLVTGAASRIQLVNGTKPNRVFWQVTGSTTLGAASAFSGTILGSGAIVVRSGVRFTGRALSMTGSVTLTDASFTSLSPLRLRTASAFSVLGGSTVNNVGPTTVNLDVGVSPGTVITGFPPGTTSGTMHAGDAVAAQAHADAVGAYEEAASLDASATIAGDLGGLTLRSGVYASAAAVSVSTTLILDGQNDPNGVWIFKVNAALGTAASSRIRLINGADLSRVFWQVTGAVSLGAASEFSGTVLSPATITVGTNMQLDGRVISLDGAVSLSTNTVASPPEEPGTLTATANGATLGSVVLDGVTTQFATGQSTGWSVSDERGSGARWTLTLSATVPTSAAGTADTIPRQLPVGSLAISTGPITAMSGTDSAVGLTPSTLQLTDEPQTLLSSPGAHRGTYTFDPAFTLTVPPGAYRSNFVGSIDGSPLNPYVAVITVTVF
ncbi:MAG: DUF3494 domain-containing protein [Burkholderiaceae bacterium]|nr:DUF3494 domain-containing protein [Microbacteriaceae bacterium]